MLSILCDGEGRPRALVEVTAVEVSGDEVRERFRVVHRAAPDVAGRTTYLLVDGENIDATLGNSILGRRPRPEERPRWDRLLEWTERAFDQDVAGLFFLAAGTELPTTFVQALIAIGYKPVPLSGAGQGRRHRHPAHGRGAGPARGRRGAGQPRR